MKLEFAGWKLSLYEAEYNEVCIETNSVRIVNGRNEVQEIKFPTGFEKIQKIKIDDHQENKEHIREAYPPKMEKDSKLQNDPSSDTSSFGSFAEDITNLKSE